MSNDADSRTNSATGPAEKILIVDDEETIVTVLGRGLARRGFAVTTARCGQEALLLLKTETFAALLTDVQMPGIRGDVLQRLAREITPDLAVLLVAGAGDLELAVACMREGVADYVSKPFDLGDVAIRLRNALDKRRMVIELRLHREELESLVERRSAELRQQFLRAMESLCSALEAKDAYTYQHSERVCRLAVALVHRVCPDDSALCTKIELAARLHDIGKIGVPESVIGKPGKLTEEEFCLIRQHPMIGKSILQPLVKDTSILEIVRYHHEHWDGTGYPEGLSGEQIPLGARILAVADAFDAMTSSRPYRSAMPLSRALEILQSGAGTQWDATIVQALLAHDCLHSTTLPS